MSFHTDNFVSSRSFVELDMSCHDILSAKGLLAMRTREWFVLYVYGNVELVPLQDTQMIKLTAPFMPLCMTLVDNAAYKRTASYM
jgi:hypothetical protein